QATIMQPDVLKASNSKPLTSFKHTSL
ncbi:uncharacterized protein METZ01_LOCUS287828, partial [marine metagenome]